MQQTVSSLNLDLISDVWNFFCILMLLFAIPVLVTYTYTSHIAKLDEIQFDYFLYAEFWKGRGFSKYESKLPSEANWKAERVDRLTYTSILGIDISGRCLKNWTGISITLPY